MIVGDIKNVDKEKHIYPDALVKGIEYLKNTDFSKLEDGAYEIDGEAVVANVFHTNTALKSEKMPEVHRKYIDIQYLLEGEEIIGFARDTGEYEVYEDLIEHKDLIFYKGDIKHETDLIMSVGIFAVFFSDDIHRPGCTYGKTKEIRKVVIKVDTNALK